MQSSTKNSFQWIPLAFLIVYVAWGATYLAIRIGLETIPPLLLGGYRFLLAGSLLCLGLRWFHPTGFRLGSIREWRDAGVVGLLLIPGGNGLVSLAERSIPSGVAALTVALVPLWILLFEWIRPNGLPPSRRAMIGLGIGLIGMTFLVNLPNLVTLPLKGQWGYFFLLVAGVSWAAGAVYSRHAAAEGSPLLAIGRQMLLGGTVSLLLACGHGELNGFHWAAVSPRSLWAFAYLVLFGALLGFSAFVWLMKVSTPARVSTTSYVNPVIAVLLGVFLGGEHLTPSQVIGGLLIVCAVIVVLTERKKEG